MSTQEAQYYEDLLGRGKGDPDMYGYPGEHYYAGTNPPEVEVIVEEEDAILFDMLEHVDEVPTKLEKGDVY